MYYIKERTDAIIIPLSNGFPLYTNSNFKNLKFRNMLDSVVHPVLSRFQHSTSARCRLD